MVGSAWLGSPWLRMQVAHSSISWVALAAPGTVVEEVAAPVVVVVELPAPVVVVLPLGCRGGPIAVAVGRRQAGDGRGAGPWLRVGSWNHCKRPARRLPPRGGLRTRPIGGTSLSYLVSFPAPSKGRRQRSESVPRYRHLLCLPRSKPLLGVVVRNGRSQPGHSCDLAVTRDLAENSAQPLAPAPAAPGGLAPTILIVPGWGGPPAVGTSRRSSWRTASRRSGTSGCSDSSRRRPRG